MSRPVDERIVKLSMDDSSFRSNGERSIGLLGRLTAKLSGVKNMNLDKSVQSMNSLGGATNKVDLSKLISAAETVTNRFSALGIMATTVLVNIANRAVQAGMTLAKSMTVQGAMDGFTEYELKMKSIQTILSNTQGNSSLGEIKDTLEELNVYADKTIYSFADMTSNIGTFTAAGVNLKDSATAIKGISNLAAASGSNTQQASTAMYQLSQALANGKVNLQDWNSVVNAGMGGKLFQNALKETAKGIGQNVDESKSFRDSLQDGWLTTDVLIQTLDRFSKDQSMLDAATKVRTFTQLVDTAREAVGSGWAITWEKLFGDFEEAGVMWTNANNVISASIDSSADARNALIQSFVDMGGRSKLIDIAATSFKVLSQIVGTVKSAFRDVFPPVTAETLIKMTDAVLNFVKGLEMSESTANKVKSVFRGLFSVLSIGITVIKLIGKAFLNLIPDGMGGDLLDIAAKFGDMITEFAKSIKSIDGVQDVMKALKQTSNDVYSGIKSTWGTIASLFDNLGATIAKMWGVVKPALVNMKNAIKDMLTGISGGDIATAGFFATVFMLFKKFSTLGDKLGDTVKKLGSLLDKAKDSIGFFADLGDALKSLTGAVKAGTLLAIAAAILSLALALGMLGNMKTAEITKGLASIAAIMKLLDLALTSMMKHSGGIIKAGAIAITLASLSSSILVLSAALKIIGSMSPDSLATGLQGMAAMIMMLVAAIKVLSTNEKHAITGATAMLGLATAIVIMSGAVKMLGSMNPDAMDQGLKGLAGILLALTAFLLVTNGSKMNLGTAASLFIIATSLGMMTDNVSKIGDMDINKLKQGLIGLGVVLAELAVTARLMGGAGSISGAIAIIAMAKAVDMLVPSLRAFAAMSPDNLAKSIITIGVSLGILVLAVQGAKGAVSGAVALVLVAASLNLLVPVLQKLGAMSWEAIAKGLVTFSVALGVAAIASKVIGVTGSVGLIAFALAVTGVSLAAIAVSAAIATFLAALNALATIGVVAIQNIITAVGLFVDGLATLGPKIGNAIVVLGLELVKSLIALVPAIVNAGFVIIKSFLQSITEHLPDILALGVDIVVQLIQGIGEAAPRLLSAAVELIVDLVNGLANAIRDNSEPLIDAVFNIVEAVLEVLIDALGKIIEVMFGWIPGVKKTIGDVSKSAKEALREGFDIKDAEKIGSDAAKGYGEGLKSGSSSAKDGGKSLGDGGKAGAQSVEYKSLGKDKAVEFKDGMTTYIDAPGAGARVANDVKDGIGQVDLTESGAAKMSQFGMGLGSSTAPEDAAAGKANGARDALNLPDFTAIGKAKGDQFGAGVQTADTTTAGLNTSNKAVAALGIPDFTTPGITKGGDFVRGVDSNGVAANSAGNNISSQAKNGATLPDFSAPGRNKGSDFANGVRSQTGSASTAGNTISTRAKNSASAIGFTGTGSAKGNEFVSGVRSIDSTGAGTGLSTRAKSGAESVDASGSGAFFGEGFASGIDSKQGRAASAGSTLGSIAKSAMDKILSIFSPSRATKKSGGYFGDGLVIGIDNKRKEAAGAGERLGTSALDSVNSVTRSLAESLEGSMDVNPVITPVVDASNLKALSNLSGNAHITGDFATNSPAASIDNATMKQMSIIMSGQNTSDSRNRKLEDKLDKLITTLFNLIDALPKTINVNSYMDKQLVGEGTAPIVKETIENRAKLLASINGR